MDNLGGAQLEFARANATTTQDSNQVAASATLDYFDANHTYDTNPAGPISLSYTLTGPHGDLISWSTAYSSAGQGTLNVGEHFAGVLPQGEIVSNLKIDMVVSPWAESHALSQWDNFSKGGVFTVDLAGLLTRGESFGQFGLPNYYPKDPAFDIQHQTLSRGDVTALFHSSAVPEPSSLILLLGSALVAWVSFPRRDRRRRTNYWYCTSRWWGIRREPS